MSLDNPGKTKHQVDMPSLSAQTRAVLWMTGAITSFIAMAIAGRAVSLRHDTFEIMAARSVVGLVLVVAGAAALGRLGDISPQRLRGHLLRNVVHFTGQNLWFWALPMIPLAQVFALEFTSPLWVILLAPLLLGERFSRRRLFAAGVGFAGILIVTRPFGAGLSLGVAAAAGSAIFFALTSILTKRLTRAESITGILFWLTLMQFGFGLIGAGVDGRITPPDAASLPWLLLIGFAGVMAHLSLTSALRLASAGFVMPIDFVRLPLIALVGAAFYDEPLDPFVLAGGVVILLGVWMNLRAERALISSDALAQSGAP